MQALSALQAESAEAIARVGRERGEFEGRLKSASEYINRMMNERSDIEKKFHSMKDDLITRLQNACGQRDEARAQVGPLWVWAAFWGFAERHKVATAQHGPLCVCCL